MTPQTQPRWPLLAVAVLAALPAVNGLDATFDHDTWWHLKVGEWVVEHRGVPVTDPFSQFGREQPVPWRAYSWLHEVLLFKAFDVLGPAGVYAARAILAAASTAVLFAFAIRRLGPQPVALVPVALLGLILVPLSNERPWHYTLAFTGMTAWAVTSARDGYAVRKLWWLPFAFAVWANVHIQFVLGWGVLGLACLFPGQAKRSHVIALTAACVIATAVNPYHVRLAEVIFEYATQRGPLQLVAELEPPSRTASWTLASFGMLAGSLAWNLRRRPIDPFAVALILAGAVLSARMTRDLWFGALAAVAALPSVRPGQWKPAAAAVVAVFAAALLFGSVSGYGPPEGDIFPKAAAEWVRAEKPAGPMYNDFDCGGYLIWVLPEYPVSVDGRTNLYGSDRLFRTHAAWFTADGWERDPAFANARFVIAPAALPLTGALRGRPEWRVGFEDSRAVVFVRQP